MEIAIGIVGIIAAGLALAAILGRMVDISEDSAEAKRRWDSARNDQ